MDSYERRGSAHQYPLPDGREIVVYPQLFGAGLLCIGPQDCPIGYDRAWRYETLYEALEAALRWTPMAEWNADIDVPPGKPIKVVA